MIIDHRHHIQKSDLRNDLTMSINEELEQFHRDRLARGDPLPRAELRPYQQELSEISIKENTIIFLGTGCGKTFISVMLINSAEISAQIVQENKRVVFLAPTQDLAKQQAQYLQKQTRYRCKVYCGRSARVGLQIDRWDRSIWNEEFESIEIAVMTAQIFANSIATNIMDWEKFATVIFDEGHHIAPTKKNKESKHPYRQLMRHYDSYYDKKLETQPRPRLLILTASLINCLPKNNDDLEEQVRYLERVYKARCRTNLEVQSSLPRFVIFSYECDSLNIFNDTLTSLFEELRDSLQVAFKVRKAQRAKTKIGELDVQEITMLKFLQRLKLCAAGYSIKPKQFPDIFEGLIKVRKTLGLWTLHALLGLFITAVSKVSGLTIKDANMVSCYKEFTNLLIVIKEAIGSALIPTGSTQDSANLLLGTSTAKMRALLDLLKREYNRTINTKNESFSCIIFIRSRLETVGLASWLKQVSQHCEDYKFISTDYAIGMAAAQTSKYSCVTRRQPEDQMRMLNNFRNSTLNTLLTTSVLEEGIDLPVCSTVIRYNTANNLREYIQSRGRARKTDSSYISICEVGKDHTETVDRLNMFNNMEIALMNYFKSSKSDSAPSCIETTTKNNIDDTDEYFRPKDDVCISTSMACTLLSMYFYYAAKGAPYVPTPQVVRAQIAEKPIKLIQSTLYLPSGCPIREGIKGKIKASVNDADMSAALEAVKKLHELKEIDENCVPYRATKKNIHKELSALKVLPDEIIENRELKIGELFKEETRQEFIPTMRAVAMNLSNDTMRRRYYLYGLKFIPEKFRLDMEQYFQPMIIGIITDITEQELSKVLPSMLNNHYGSLSLEIVELTNKLSLNIRDHNYYLDFMFNYLRRCLGLNLNINSLRDHCPLYIVPLKKNISSQSDPKSFIDDSMMRNSFKYENSYRQVKPDNIVVLSRRIRGKTNDFFLVDKVHSDLGPNHQHVDMKKKVTFGEDAKMRYNLREIKQNQPVIRVRPLSKEVANFTHPKDTKTQYKSTAIHFLEEMLEFFHSDPCFILQTFFVPPLMFRIFQIRTTKLVIDDMATGSDQYRKYMNEDVMHIDDDHEKDEKDKIDLDGDGEISDEEENYSVYDDSESDLDYHSSDENRNEELRMHPIDDSEQDREFFPWNPAEYETSNRTKLNFESQYHSNNMFYSYRDNFKDFDDHIKDLPNMVAPIMVNLMNAINALESKLTTDQDLPDDDEQQDETAKVDRSVQAEMRFDVFAPEAGQSRIEPMLKALTLRRAGDLFDLERYENVGDSFLKFLTSVYLYNRLDGKEGILSQLRSSLVSNDRLCQLASRKGLGNLAVTRSCRLDYLGYLLGGNTPRDKANCFDNRLKNKDLADIFEAIVGAQLIHFGHIEAIITLRWLGLNLLRDDELLLMRDGNQRIMINSNQNVPMDDEKKNHLKRLVSRVHRFQSTIGYKFKDKRHIVQAFTHPTCISNKVTRSYQRLEFLGDAILDYLVTRHIFQHDKSLKPGEITDIRAALVNNYTFAKLALKYQFDLYIDHSQQNLHDELSRIRSIVNELSDNKLELGFEDLLEFDEIVKLLADIFESVAGAIFLDSESSLDTVWSVYYPMMKETIERELQEPTKNPVRQLYETFTGPGMVTFVKTQGQDSETKKTVLCKINGLAREFKGVGHTLKDAKLRAALVAIKHKPPAEELAELIKKNGENRVVTHVKTKNVANHRFRGSISAPHRTEPSRSRFSQQAKDPRSQNRSSEDKWRTRR